MRPSEIHQILKEFLEKQCSPAFASLFDLTKLNDFPLDNNSESQFSLVKNFTKEEINSLENLFVFNKSEIDLSPDRKNKASLRNTILPRLFFSLLKDNGDYWMLTRLNLKKCREIPPDQLVSIISACTNLHEINLNNCQQLTNSHLAKMTLSPSLSGLHLSNLTVKGDVIVPIVVQHPDVTELDLSRTHVETKHLEQMMKAAPRLRHLNLSGSHSIEGLAIIQFIKQHPELRKIVVNACTRLRSSSLAQLKDAAPYLREFSFKGSVSNPILFDFNVLIALINHHAFLEKLNAEHWILYGKNLEEALTFAADRETSVSLRLSQKNIQFPNLSQEAIFEKINKLVSEYKRKKILILLQK